MDLARNKRGDVVMLIGALLYLIAVVVDASTVLVAGSILVFMGGAILTGTGRAGSKPRS